MSGALQEADRGVRLLAALGAAPCGYVCVHPGARLPSRRWYPERFALVADALAERGLRVVLAGTAAEAALARRVAERMRAPFVDLTGRTTLGALTALIDGARLVVANDTGVRQIATARGTPCVTVACGTDVRRSAAREPNERVLYADVPCRPCAHARCPVGHTCAQAVDSREVLAAADELLALSASTAEPASSAASRSLRPLATSRTAP